MNYIIINHAPFALTANADLVRGIPAVVDDFTAQAAALKEVGLRLLVAAPVVPPRHAAAGRCDSPPFSPDERGFELLHLPIYQSLRSYLRVRKKMTEALQRHCAAGDIVQMGYGGHPMMLGEMAWPICEGLKRVWMFDAVDPFTAMQRSAKEKGVIRRAALERLTSHKITFCRSAIKAADLVFAHHPSIADRFADVWGEHCHQLDAPLFGADEVPDEDEINQRSSTTADKKSPLRLLTFGPNTAADPADHILRAIAHCHRLSVPVELLIIGSEQQCEPMMQMAANLGMSKFAKRFDKPTSVRWLMTACETCDAVISAAAKGIDEFETFGAMAAGLAMVAYENPATDRLIETADCGVVVPSGNVLLLAQAVIDLHRSRRTLARLGENAWRAAQKRTREAIHRQRAAVVASSIVPSPSTLGEG